jgi:hypothetical protein
MGNMYADYLAQQMSSGEGAPAAQGENYAVGPAPSAGGPQYAMQPAAPRRHRPAMDPGAVPAASAQEANDAHIRASIASKLARSPVLGIKDDSLLGMDKLAQLGIEAQPNEQGIPYGLDLGQLNGLEHGWLMRRVR